MKTRSVLHSAISCLLVGYASTCAAFDFQQTLQDTGSFLSEKSSQAGEVFQEKFPAAHRKIVGLTQPFVISDSTNVTLTIFQASTNKPITRADLQTELQKLPTTKRSLVSIPGQSLTSAMVILPGELSTNELLNLHEAELILQVEVASFGDVPSTYQVQGKLVGTLDGKLTAIFNWNTTDSFVGVVLYRLDAKLRDAEKALNLPASSTTN